MPESLYEEELYSRIDDGKGDAPRHMHDLIVQPRNDDGTRNGAFRPKFHNWRRAAKVPVLVLNSTSLNTGHLWQFTATWMGEPPGEINVAIDGNERLRRMYYQEAPPETSKDASGLRCRIVCVRSGRLCSLKAQESVP